MSRPVPKKPPLIRLAHVPGAQGDNVLLGRNSVPQLPREKWPSLLFSFFYLDGFLAEQHRYAYRDWVLDSGAFSAYASGAVINVYDYIETCKYLLSSAACKGKPPYPFAPPKEVFALDVIGDWKTSLANAELMWANGVPAVPTFHYGEPWHVLTYLAKNYPKIAIGGCVGKRDKEEFAAQCFARVWPKRMHGFNFASERSMLHLPWETTDSTDWEIKPAKFGHWRSFGSGGSTAYMNWRGSAQNLTCEVDWYLDLEDRARSKWHKEMIALESLNEGSPL